MKQYPFATDFGKYVLLNESVSWTPDLVRAIKKDRGSVDRIMSGNTAEIKRFFNGHKEKMANFISYMEQVRIGEIEEDIKRMSIGGISLYTLFDDDYPFRLRQIADPPLVLYHIGTLFDMSKCVAISGTRDPEPDVRSKTFELASMLAEAGFTIASGLAKGVDTCAHEGALSFDGGYSVAVMASGLDRVIPKCNIPLAKHIAQRGAVLSEKSLRPEPTRYDFIRRNRIISGISGVQIIMQSSGSGGTEHQFNIASGQGRPVIVYNGADLPEASRRSAGSMISRGARGFSSISEALDLVKEEWNKEGSPARGEVVTLEHWG